MVIVKSQTDKKGDPLKLTIIPPLSIKLPPTLLSHSVERPSQTSTSSAAGIRSDARRGPHPVRCHPNFLKARKMLAEVGLSLPTPLMADRGVWLSQVVDEVEFDLAGEEVRVAMVDGVNFKWNFAELDKVPIEEVRAEDPEIDVGEMVGLAEEGFVATQPFLPCSTQPRSPSQDRLHQLIGNLRTAFEDLKLSLTLDPRAPQVSGDADYATLVNLAADPTFELPRAWRNPPSQPITEPGTLVDDKAEGDCKISGPIQPLPSRGIKEPSPLYQSSLPIEEGDDLADGDPDKYKGQLANKRGCTTPIDSAPFDQSVVPTGHLPDPNHYLFATIGILSAIRKAALDLFSLKLIALLKAKIGSPTYPLWAAASAAKWCRRLARQKGAYVSRLVLQLLDDADGDQFDQSEESDELDDEVSRMEVEDEGEWAGFGGFGGFFMTMDGRRKADSPTEEERKERRRKRNVFYHMRDDYDLRMWCQQSVRSPP